MSKVVWQQIWAAPALLVALAGSRAPAQAEGAHGAALFDLASPRFGGWRLVLEGRAFLQAQSQNPDPRWLRLSTAGLQTMADGNGSPLDLNLALGGKRLQWALVDSARKVHASGEGSPDLLLLEGALRKNLEALPWETLAEILKAHPEHGEARFAEAESQLAFTAPSFFGDPRIMARHERLRPQTQAALDKLLEGLHAFAQPGGLLQRARALLPVPKPHKDAPPVVIDALRSCAQCGGMILRFPLSAMPRAPPLETACA